MKRSEMVVLLEDTIKFARKNQLGADVLYAIEKLGMLPPDAMPPALSLGEQATKDAIWARTRFRWEPENEK